MTAELCRCCQGEEAQQGQCCRHCLRQPGDRITEGHIRGRMRGPRLYRPQHPQLNGGSSVITCCFASRVLLQGCHRFLDLVAM